jgi:hypothetical protein
MKKDKEKTFFRRLFGGGSCCCGPTIAGVRQIDVGGNKIGIVGLNETFEGLYRAGTKPEYLHGAELIEALKEMNHIPEGAKEKYKEAFLREYQRYYKVRMR